VDWIISPITALGEQVDALRSFKCGHRRLDNYIKKTALNNHVTGISTTWVAYIKSCTGAVELIGFYCISMSEIKVEDFPSIYREGLPKYPMPAMLIGQFAVQRAYQGQGLGKKLLFDALGRAIRLSEDIGIYAIRLEAIDDRAKNFYQKYGFTEYENNEKSLFLLMSTLLATRPPS
jgi:GNAT superfamily N-acetyltransferase